MAFLVYNYEDLVEPNLSIPGSEPIGPVIVRPENDFVIYSLYQKNLLNLADHTNPGVPEGTATSINPYIRNKKGSAVKVHPTGGANGFDLINYNKPNVVENDDDFTTFCWIKVVNVSFMRFSYRGIGADSVRFYGLNSTTIRAAYIDSSPLVQHNCDITVPTLSVGDYVIAAARKCGNKLKAWARINDGSIYSGSEAVGGSGTMRNDGAGNIWSPNPNAHEEIIFYAVAKKACSDSLIVDALRDPYQFLTAGGDIRFLGTSAPVSAGGGLVAGSLSLMGMGL